MNKKNNFTLAEAEKKIKTGKNIFLTGYGGTGKTTLLKKYIKEMKDNGKTVMVLAPTGIAAINIGGRTMHSVCEIPIPAYGYYECDIQKKQVTKLAKADIVIIEEISMCRNDVFEYFTLIYKKAKKIKPKLQVIVCGDFFQLPPVVRESEKADFKRLGLDPSGFCFTSPDWEYYNFEPVTLTKVMRQCDEELVENLDKVRHGDASCLAYFNKRVLPAPSDDMLFICGVNAKAARINDTQMRNINSKSKTYYADVSGFPPKDTLMENELTLKIGCKVMFLSNDIKSHHYQNGTTGVVCSLSNDCVSVRVGNRMIRVEPIEITNYKIEIKNGQTEKKKIGSMEQIPLKVAYATTIHKTQGQTFDEAYISPDIFEAGQLYVALSRIKKYEGIYLSSAITEQHLKVNKMVIDFYNNGCKYAVSEAIIKKKQALAEKANISNLLSKNNSQKKTKAKPKATTPSQRRKKKKPNNKKAGCGKMSYSQWLEKEKKRKRY